LDGSPEILAGVEIEARCRRLKRAARSGLLVHEHGFLVSDSADGPVAVLMDQQSGSSGSLKTTASGFDLHTGENLWGPVEVPGPLLGSGLVFAGPPEDFIGAGGPRTALDPASGAELAVEDGDSPRVLALLDGHLVLADGEELIGEDVEGRRLWTRPLADLGLTAAEARETPWEAVGDSHALLGSGGGQHTLIDLRSGKTVASDIDGAGFDSRSRTLVTSDSKLHGFDLDGTKRWDAPLDGDAELSAVGAGLVITESDPGGADDDGMQTRSADDGQLLDAAEEAPESGDFGAPHHIADSGARLVGDPGSPLLIPPVDRSAKR
ncbi:MAG TPA: PQQ-binding-like beta-propeller repeat protein, partial [Brevibacterium epidermidis]|nr:PQQ-binding-like beta-propeller repeat protein [Brevibacterium epidermidis]